MFAIRKASMNNTFVCYNFIILDTPFAILFSQSPRIYTTLPIEIEHKYIQ